MLLRKKMLALVAGAALMTNVAGCGKEEETEEDKPQTLGDVRGSGGASGSGGTESQEVTELNVVQSTMVPGSLIVGGASLTQDDDPCADSDGFFDCQPELLKVYVKMSKDLVKLVTDIYAGLDSTILPILPIGNGQFEINDSDGDIEVLHYNIVDANEYALMGETAKGPAIHVDVKRTDTETTYILRHDGSMGSDDGEKHNKIEVTVVYRSATDFDVNFLMEGGECDPDDIRSPRRINIKSSYANAIWTGKAQMYMPLWLYKATDGVTCDSTATDDTKMFFYTNYVGTDANTTAAIYLADKGLTDVANYDTYAAGSFCSNFSSFCFNGYGFEDPNPVASYSNPFCVTKDADTVWGSACTDLGVDQFSADTGWDLPAALEAKVVTVPSSL